MSDQQIDEFDVETALSASFVRPERHFKGLTVRHCTQGSEAIMHLTGNSIFRPVESQGDESAFHFSVWSFIFAHTQDLKHVRELAFKKDKGEYRNAVLDWTDQFIGKEDINEAIEIVSEVIKEYKDAGIEIKSDPNKLQAPIEGNEPGQHG